MSNDVLRSSRVALPLTALVIALACVGCRREPEATPAADAARAAPAAAPAATATPPPAVAAAEPDRAAEPGSVPVTADNFVRAESDRYLGALVKEQGLGKLFHHREPASIDSQTVVRLNRDTLYSSAVFDLDAGPVTITLPDAGDRFMSMQVIDEDQYTTQVNYTPGAYTLSRGKDGTRYVVVALRTLVDPSNPEDVAKVHALQDAIRIQQAAPGSFDVPRWDTVSQDKVRAALLTLASTLPDTRHMFGTRDTVDPVRRVIGAASAWGGNPDKDALYLNVVPERNDGRTVYRLHVADVPVDGFWSVSLYNAQGYYEKNPQNAYTLNNLTAKKGADGSIDIQFGGCDGQVPNCLPTMPGWNYMVRLYRPRAELLDGRWTFPEAVPVQ
ncbi:DUF1254 domain-containing protein [Stenotrophomonas rhizophila]|uniref:DUF1254 domain-containing protein n=1 Tax=Stenotrophomonas rhizophila TaxID=216778 RepID=UPI0021B4A1CF|nr:DUF1254 domain-containing protein [Stenotrophomonas rhizophila]